MDDKDRSEQPLTRHLDRRTFLKMTLGTTGVVLLAACGQAPAAGPAAGSAAQPAGSGAAAASPAAPTTAAAAAGAPGTPKRGGTLSFGLDEDPPNWTPHNVVDCANQTVMAHIWSSLLRYNGKGELVGDVAESWKWQDDKTMVFQLRKNVKWHNGDLLTADQVVKSENDRLDPKTCIDGQFLSSAIAKWEAVDSNTVKCTLKEPNATMPRWLTTAPGRAFILHPSYDAKTCGQSAAATIGTGPFKYKSYEPGAKVSLVRNTDYFIEGMPYLDAVDFMVVQDPDARVTDIRSGQLQMIGDIDYQALPTLRKDPNIYIPEGKGFYGCRLTLDLTAPPTNDLKVRQALNFAINRQMIVDNVLAGEGTPVYGGIIPPGRFGYDKKLDGTYKYDPAKAKALLAEAGWQDSNGVMVKDGQPMTLTYETYGPNIWWSQVAEVIQANLKDIGIAVKLDVKPWDEFKVIRKKYQDTPEGTPGSWTIMGGTIWGLDLADMPAYVMPGGYNWNRYNNPKLRDLLLKASATIDDATREDLLRQAQEVWTADAPDILVAWMTRSEAVRTNVKNFHHLDQDGCFGTLIWESYLDPQSA